MGKYTFQNPTQPSLFALEVAFHVIWLVFPKMSIRKKGRKNSSLSNDFIVQGEYDNVRGFLSMKIVLRTTFQNFNPILML